MGTPLVPLGGTQVAGAALDLRAFAAELAFTLPEETREVLRSLQRTEFARRESERLGLAVDAAWVEARMVAFEASLRHQLGGEEAAEAGGDGPLDRWSQQRYDRSWAELRPVFARHLADNLRYQLCLRASSYEVPRLRLQWLVAGEEATAAAWARSLRAGLDPERLMGDSLLSPPQADGSWPPLPLWPSPLLAAMATEASAGAVLGPMQFPGDRSWRVAYVLERLPAKASVPPTAVLLDELERYPIDALEARAWFEAMTLRYTAHAEFPVISGPSPAFVPLP